MATSNKYGAVIVRRGKSIQQEKAHDTELAIQQARKWIEECTNTSQPDVPFRELVKDGTLLCELIQRARPGLIKKINRSKKPFGGRENLSFFLDACQKLGLKGSQLFEVEDLQGLWTTSLHGDLRSNNRGRRDDGERKLKNVAVTIYWLGKTLNQLPGYTGPELDLSAFHNLVGSQRRRSHSAAGRYSNSSSANSSVTSTPTKHSRNDSQPVSSSSNCTDIEASSSKTPLDSSATTPEKHPVTSTALNVNVHKSISNGVFASQHDILKSSLPAEATSPSSPAPANTHKEEELTDSCPVTPVTPLCSEQYQLEEHCNTVHYTNNNNNNTTIAEEPVVGDIEYSRDLVSVELQYTIADASILDVADLQTTSTPQLTKSVNFEESSSTDKTVGEEEVEMYRVDTSDNPDSATTLNEHLLQSPARDDGRISSTDITTLHKLSSKEFDVVIKLETGEKRFGFSVIGGIDEGFPPRVESIAGGSAASKVDLNSGDQLVAMDDTLLAGLDHAEIIRMIQKASLNGHVMLHIRRIVATESSSAEDDMGPKMSVINTTEQDDSSSGASEVEGDKKEEDDKGNEEDDKVNNGYVKVETKAVPTPQHPTMVLCAPEHAREAHHTDIIDTLSNENETRTELGSNPEERSVLSEQPEATPALNTADNEAEVTVNAMSSTEVIVSPPTTEDDEDDEGEHGAPKGVVVLPSPAALTSTMSVVRPRSAPQSKLRRVLPAESDNCYANYDGTQSMNRHQSQKSVPEVMNPPLKEMHKYASLPTKGKYLSAEKAMGGGGLESSRGFTVLNSFKDSREAIDEIWKSVTLEGSSQLEKTPEVASDSPGTSHHSSQIAVSMSSSLAVNANDGDYGSPSVNGDLPDNARSPSEDACKGASVSMLQLMEEIKDKVGREEDAEDYKALERIIKSPNFNNLMEMCTLMRQLIDHNPQPIDKHVTLSALLMRKKIRETDEPSRDMLELRALLQDPDVQAMMFCHDRVATGDLMVSEADAGPYNNITDTASAYSHDTSTSSDGLLVAIVDPILRSSTIHLDAWDRRDKATIVYITKTDRPLGATIYKQEESMFIGHLLKGCDAERSGVVHEGDELLEINGIPVVGKTVEQIGKLMSGLGGARLALTIIPANKSGDTGLSESVYVRAYFDYNPGEDSYIPCRDLGLPFNRGDILEIINHDDPNWWQARRIDQIDTDSQPGLIPAKHMQERREALRMSHPAGNFYQRQRRKGLLYKMKKKKKVYYTSQIGSEGLSVGDEILTYEEVVRLQPEERLKRPIVLIGAQGVGKTTLQKMLITRYPDRYAYCVPFTSRPIKAGEVSGQDYHFISREQIEKEINANKFVEYKEVKGYYYGVHMASVSNVLLAGKSPVLELQHPQSLKVLRNKNLMPYVIFIASPSVEQLYATRRNNSPERSLKKKRNNSEGDVMGDEMEQLFWASQQIEIHYAPYFDSTIVNDELSLSFDLLLEVIEKIEQEPQWVPSSWIQPNNSSWVVMDSASR